MKKFTEKQKHAIMLLEDAFRRCAERGLVFSVMDADLWAARKDNCDSIRDEVESAAGRTGCYPIPFEVYQKDKEAAEKVNTFKAMESCGGY